MLVTLLPITALIVAAPDPVPELVIVPVLLTVAVLNVIVPVLLALSVKLPVPVMPPVTEIFPLLVPIEASLPNDTAPIYVPAVPLEFVKAPLALIPEPFMVRALALAITLPFRSRVAPLLTVMELAATPNAVVLPACRVPLFTVVPPAYVFAAENITMPA